MLIVSFQPLPLSLHLLSSLPYSISSLSFSPLHSLHSTLPAFLTILHLSHICVTTLFHLLHNRNCLVPHCYTLLHFSYTCDHFPYPFLPPLFHMHIITIPKYSYQSLSFFPLHHTPLCPSYSALLHLASPFRPMQLFPPPFHRLLTNKQSIR